MASESGRSGESLHVLLARVGARAVAAPDRNPESNAAEADNLAAYIPPRHRDRAVGAVSQEDAVMNIEDEMRKLATEKLSALPQEKPRYDFFRLGDEIAGSLEKAALAQLDAAKEMLEKTRIDAEKFAAALVQIAEERVTQAEKILAEVQDPANGLRDQIKKVDQELADLTDRLKQFGETVLQAHLKFQDGKPTGSND